MLVLSLIERKGGTVVTFGAGDSEVKYHFAPNDKGHHVAEVTDDDHAAALLHIPEGYAVYDPTGTVSEEELASLLGDDPPAEDPPAEDPPAEDPAATTTPAPRKRSRRDASGSAE